MDTDKKSCENCQFCMTKAQRRLTRITVFFCLIYLIVGIGRNYQYTDELEISDRRTWALMLEQERQQHRLKENFELKKLKNINIYKGNQTNSSKEVLLEIGPVVYLS